MDLTENDIMELLKDYIKTPSGKSVLKEAGMSTTGYSESEMKSIAAELRDSIINAYLSIVRDPGKYFDVSAVKINSPRDQKDGTWKIVMSFTDKALFRHSLYSDWGTSKKGTSTGFTGAGVTDIFSLFTNGYSARKSVYGTWWDNQTNDGDRGNLGLIRSRRYRSANDFISRAVNSFRLKYPDIKISYPSEWGGDI